MLNTYYVTDNNRTSISRKNTLLDFDCDVMTKAFILFISELNFFTIFSQFILLNFQPTPFRSLDMELYEIDIEQTEHE